MREILFRAKGKGNGEWVTGFYTHFANDKGSEAHRIYSGYAETDCGDYYPDFDSVLSETVSEYTGLTDKNGVRIFEGDILQSTESGMKALVQYFPEHGAFMLWCRDESTNQIEYIGEVEMLMVEVIGNIHDNIELFPEYAGGDDHAAD